MLNASAKLTRIAKTKLSSLIKRAGLTQIWHRLNRDNLVWWSVGLVGVWRFLLELLNQSTAWLLEGKTPSLALLNRWANWDGGWYLNINNKGYQHTPGPIVEENVAFFPGFPETVGIIANSLRVDHLAAGLVLNFFLTVGAVYLLMRLAELLAVRYGTGRNTKRLAVLSAVVLLVFPSSFFLAAYYAEAMLLLGSVGAVYCALRRQFWLAVPFMIMATASKVTGLIVVLTVAVIAFEQWRQDRNSKLLLRHWLITVLGIAGLVAFMIYLGACFGDPILFYNIQQAWGRNAEGFFIVRLLQDNYLHALDPAYFGSRFNYLLQLCWMMTPIVLLGIAFIGWRAYRTYWPLLLAGLAMGLPLSTGILDSIYRYALVVAPLVPLFVVWSERSRPSIAYAVIVLSGLAMVVFAAVFLEGSRFAG